MDAGEKCPLIFRLACVLVTLHCCNFADAVQWIEHTGSCYLFPEVNQAFSQAEMTCAGYGSGLAEVETVGEYLVINELIVVKTEDYWVGLRKVTSSSPFTWSDGSEAPASMWADGEPNGTGDCVRLVKYYVTPSKTFDKHYLADSKCSSTNRPLCEKPASKEEATSTRLTQLPASLCHMQTLLVLSHINCAQACTLSTACYVYGFEEGTKTCSFYKIDSCANPATSNGAVKYYRMTRACN